MRGFVIFVALAGGVAVAAPVPKDKGKPKDQEAIQGTWLLDEHRRSGRRAISLGSGGNTVRHVGAGRWRESDTHFLIP